MPYHFFFFFFLFSFFFLLIVFLAVENFRLSRLAKEIQKNESQVEQGQLEHLTPADQISEIEYKGATYCGELHQNQPHGKGKLVDQKMIYEGEFSNGLKEGFGRLTEIDCSIYEGEFHLDQKHGKGIMKFSNGNSYEGDFSNNKANGYGEYYYENSATYKGEWKDDLFHGKGIYSSDETRYEGEFKLG